MRTHYFQSEIKDFDKAKTMIRGGYNLKQIRNETNVHPLEIRTIALSMGYRFGPGTRLDKVASEVVKI